MSERPCGKDAVVIVHWPGREPLFMCQTHADKAKAVGLAMGCFISTETTHEDRKCTNIVTEAQ